MDASELSAMRTSGRKREVQTILAEYLIHHVAQGNVFAMAEGVRALVEIKPDQVPGIWSQLRSTPGFIAACGPGLIWKLHHLYPSLEAWNRSAWSQLPAWIPYGDEDAPPPPAAVHVLRATVTGNSELIVFRFEFRCPWCAGEHEFVVGRTLVFRRIYSCPACDGPLKADGRELRNHIPSCTDPGAVRLYEDRLRHLWHDLHRARGGHPPEAELLCQAITTHLTRVASATLSLKAGNP